MKYLIIGFVVIALISCEKEQFIGYDKQVSSYESSSFKTDGIKDIRKFINYEPTGGIVGCINVQESCHPVDIVVTGLQTEFASFDGSMSNGDVDGYFNGSEWATLFPDLQGAEYSEVLAELQSGNCTVSRTDYDGVAYYAFFTAEYTTSPMYVLPIEL
jgi:hypothetical protein